MGSKIHSSFEELILSPDKDALSYKPYPFYLAYALDKKPDELGSPKDWCYEYKWDGIRVQLIKRKDQIMMWSRRRTYNKSISRNSSLNDVLINGTVLDGELLVYKENKIGSFNDLQKRLGRKNVGKKTIEQYPIVVRAYDLLEYDSTDMRNETYDTKENSTRKFGGKIKSSAYSTIKSIPYSKMGRGTSCISKCKIKSK